MRTIRTMVGLTLCSVAIVWTVAKISATSRFVDIDVAYSFAGSPDGASSTASLMQASDGNFYGTTSAGGTFNNGTIFKLTPGGVATIIHSFSGAADGGIPYASLIQASDGNLYGTTYTGGAANRGTVFKTNLTGSTFATFYTFTAGATSGANPRAALLQSSDGSLYGTTELGGATGRGTLFQLTLGGVFSLRYTFTGGEDGAYPYAPLIVGTDGNFYGTTYSGDFSTFGRIFMMTPAGNVTVVHTFLSGGDGANPTAALVQGPDGNFYGTTFFGGASNSGTIYRLTPTGTLSILYSFTGGADGANPASSLMQATDGTFYGTAKVGALGYGTLFRTTTAGSFTVLHRFSGGADGAVPYASPFQAANGRIYGTTGFGGTFGGVVFRLPGAWPADFDQDRKSEIAVFRPSTGIWYVRQSADGASAFYQWGLNGDVPVPGDYDGDGKTDIAVYRPSTGIWYVRSSSTGASAFYQWGLTGDIPVPGDYDGDAKTDVAVFRPSTGIWYVRYAVTQTSAFYQWGLNGDVPVAADYDGDDQTDIAVYRPSTGIWYVRYSSTGASAFLQWGLTGDIPVPGDYDGDGKADAAVFRPSTAIWYVRNASTNTASFYQWGMSGDIPVTGDYDGDGKTDVAVFRPATAIWYVLQSGNSTGAFFQWGASGDIPILRRP